MYTAQYLDWREFWNRAITDVLTISRWPSILIDNNHESIYMASCGTCNGPTRYNVNFAKILRNVKTKMKKCGPTSRKIFNVDKLFITGRQYAGRSLSTYTPTPQ